MVHVHPFSIVNLWISPANLAGARGGRLPCQLVEAGAAGAATGGSQQDQTRGGSMEFAVGDKGKNWRLDNE